MKRYLSVTLSMLFVLAILYISPAVAFAVESTAPSAGSIIVINNITGKTDTIYVYGLNPGTLVKVYDAAADGNIIVYGTVAGTKTDITLSITQLGTEAGSVYVSVIGKGETESSRTRAGYNAEPRSDAPAVENTSITNNVGKSDTVYVSGLASGDTVRVYNAAAGGKLLGSKTASSSGDVTVSIAQLGSAAGNVYISVTSKNKLESSRVTAAYDAEPASDAPNAENVVVNNNAKKSDTIYISGLRGGDIVKVYNAATGGKQIGTRTVSSSGDDATITISQLGSEAGSVYMTVTSTGYAESSRIKADYDAEAASEAPNEEYITVTNNSGKADTVYVTGLAASDVVKIYSAATKGSLLGTATVSSAGNDATVSVSQLGTEAGAVYVSVTSTGKGESGRVKASYTAEKKSTAVSSGNVTVTNNVGKSDTVYISGLTGGDTVRIYDAVAGGKLLGSKTVASSGYDVTITLSQLGTDAGSIYISIAHSGELESTRTEVSYASESKSTAPDANYININNNAGTSDTIYMSKLSSGDVVKVYGSSNSGTALGSGTVAASKSDLTLTISQLGTSAGGVYISVTSTGKSESARTYVAYAAESASEGISTNNISIANNVSTSDIITVTGLSAGDVVRVYSAATSGALLGSATVASSKTEATITLSQLGTAAGSVYVTVTKSGLQESARIKADYGAEGTSTAPGANYILVTNNVGKSDTVYVGKLTGGDVVRVYDAASQGKTLGTATVASTGTEATVTLSQLGTEAGSVYVTVTSTGKSESIRTQADYRAESVSGVVDTAYITVTNNASKSDTVYMTRLSAGDLVKVYDSEIGGTLLGSATVASGATDATVTISQLGTGAGSMYVTVTSTDNLESDRVKVAYEAESSSASLTADQIVVTNNIAGTSDTIAVSGLTAGDVIKVYSAASQGTLLGSATAASGGTSVSISVTQLGTAAGNVYVSVTAAGKQESTRTESAYSAEGKSTAPVGIKVTNNAGTSDTVYVTGLTANDVVKVYDAAKGGNQLGSATVTTYSSNVTVSVSQLGSTSGSIYVTVTGTGKSESDRTEAKYDAEPSSTAPGSVTVINNSGASDTVKVTGLTSGDVVKVYDTETGGNTLGTATVASSATEATITIAQLGSAGGSIYVTVTSTNKLESGRTEVKFSAEGTSAAPDSANITVNNNAGASDTVRVTGLTAGDVVKVYDAAAGGNTLGTGTVSTYGSEVTVTISQIGTSSGSVYVTVTGTNKAESARTEAKYDAEPTSGAVSSSKITVTNNAGTSDTVKVTGLTAGDVVKVYSAASGGNQLGSATVASSSTEATVTISQLGSAAGSVYITVTSTNKMESARTEAAYSAEAQSEAPAASQVTIVNNAGIASTVTVEGLKDNDLVKIYDAASGGTLLGSGTVATYNSEVTISVSQLNTAGGSVYISVTGTGKLESDRTAVTYAAKVASTAPDASSITIVNNSGIADTVTVSGLASGTVIKVYGAESGGTALGTATVSSGSTEAAVSITQLGTGAGSVYVTAANTGKTESSRTEAKYEAEAASDALAAGNITIVNNSGMSDTITITGLAENDVVKVYNAAAGGSKLATATAASGSLTTTVSISQLGTGAGSVYITVTGTGKTESSRTEVQYAAESTAPVTSNITIVNNAGISDTITVTGLAENDVIKAYDAASGGNLLGSATVSSGSAQAVITVTQLTTTAGNVYVSATNYGRAESSLTKAAYIAEQSTTAPYIGDIYVVNNVDIADTITVYSLTAGDVVRVYDASTGGNLLGYAAAASGKTTATVSVADLGESAGYVYVSVTTKGKNESSRTAASYVAEGKSTAPYAGDIYVTNNVSIADTVLVSGLTAGDKVKVYTASTGGDLLGYATVATNDTQVTVSISQLGTEGGSVFVTVTSKGKTESNRIEAEYVSEQTTNEPYSGCISVVNNAGAADTVTITGLSAGDIVKVYDAASGGNLLGYTTVASGGTEGTVTVAQLGSAGGSVYITVTSTGKAESKRTKVDFVAE